MIQAPPLDVFVEPGFEAVADQVLDHFAADEELGCQVAVRIEGETVVDVAAGWADRDKTRPMERSTLVGVFSCSKAISALVIAWMVDRRMLTYDQPVADLWPAFAAEGKGSVTVAQALSHQAGVPGIPSDWTIADWFDVEKTAARVASLAPMWPPGTASGYHAITWGVIAGELARRADGRTLGTILREEIAAPNGIDFWIGLPEREHDRVAEMRKPRQMPEFGEINPPTRAAFLQKWSSPALGDQTLYRTAEIPAANGHGTAMAMATLADAYAREGKIGTTQVIAPWAIAEATKERIGGPDLVLKSDLSFGAGVMRNRPHRPIFGRGPRAVGHSGHGGSCVMADPDRAISFGYAMTKQSNALVIDARADRLIKAVYGCL
jgi:CubicO group peptidase (beta-lactamase class C family)